MLNLIAIMKITITFAAAIYLLRATAAYLPYRGGSQQDYHGKLVNQPGQYHALVKDLASSDYVEVEDEDDDSVLAPSVETSIKDIYEYPPASDPSPITHESSTEVPHESTVGTHSSQWAMVYHPYNSDSTCRHRDDVHEHMITIASLGFSTIRLHNHDCSILSKLASSPTVISNKIRLILGIHIDETGLEAAEPLVDEVVAWTGEDKSRWDMVEMVVVGEEAIFNGHTSAAQLSGFITSTRRKLRNAGYTGPLTTTEPLHIINESSSVLCPNLDILASNIHPFFHPEVAAKDAGVFVRESLDALEEICPGIKGVNLETGWPHKGISNGEAVPNPTEQGIAIKSIMKEAGGRSVVLGFGDDGWMEEGEFGVESSWGCDALFEKT